MTWHSPWAKRGRKNSSSSRDNARCEGGSEGACPGTCGKGAGAFFVSRAQVSRTYRLVKTLGGVPTDVVESGNVWCASACALPTARASRPFPAGISVSSSTSSAGCIGYPIRRKNDPDSYILSNYHVLGPTSTQTGPIYQPGRGDATPQPSNMIGQFAGGAPIRFGGVATNLLDAAIARVGGSTVRPELCGFGSVGGIVAPRLNRSVWMFGKESRGARGDIEDIDFDVIVGFPGGRVALFKHQVRVAPRLGSQFGVRGDSGSLVVDIDSRHACALFFARDTSGFGFATPISRVLRRFQARLA